MACRIWREADPDDARLLEAALALELTTGRRVQAYEEAEVCDRRRQMDEATVAMKANAAGSAAERRDARLRPVARLGTNTLRAPTAQEEEPVGLVFLADQG